MGGQNAAVGNAYGGNPYAGYPDARYEKVHHKSGLNWFIWFIFFITWMFLVAFGIVWIVYSQTDSFNNYGACDGTEGWGFVNGLVYCIFAIVWFYFMIVLLRFITTPRTDLSFRKILTVAVTLAWIFFI